MDSTAQGKEEPVTRWAPLRSHPELLSLALEGLWLPGGTTAPAAHDLPCAQGARNQEIHMKAAIEPIFRITTVCGVLTQKWGGEEKWPICY